jgi:hypothetical protein
MFTGNSVYLKWTFSTQRTADSDLTAVHERDCSFLQLAFFWARELALEDVRTSLTKLSRALRKT